AGMPAVAVVTGLVMLVAVSGALAVLSYRLVERPFLERKVERRDSPPVPAETTPPEKVLVGHIA
ncbi:MAG: hypothetical protein ACRD0O_11730, partial [Acidimicrobiia bacterium]